MSFDRSIKIAPSILSADFANFGAEIRAIDHDADGEPIRNSETAQEIVAREGAGAFEPLVLQEAEAEFNDIDLCRSHSPKVGLHECRVEIPTVVIATIAEGAVEENRGCL